jgi:hypothetical protein
VEIKNVDNQGRILLSKDWRDKYLKGNRAIVVYKGDTVEIKPFTKPDLAKHLDKVQLDLKSDLSNWREVRKELKSAVP